MIDFNIIINLFLIAVILVNITDISGVAQHLKRAIYQFAYERPMPDNFSMHLIECSYCQVWWAGLTYLLFTDISLINVAILLLICQSTTLIYGLQMLLYDAVNKLIIQLQKLL